MNRRWGDQPVKVNKKPKDTRDTNKHIISARNAEKRGKTPTKEWELKEWRKKNT